jgi:hypothetical protein
MKLDDLSGSEVSELRIPQREAAQRRWNGSKWAELQNLDGIFETID